MNTIHSILEARLPPIRYTSTDYMPILSTITNLALLALKAASTLYTPSQPGRWFHHATHAQGLRCCLLLVPFLGNILVLMWDRHNVNSLSATQRFRLARLSSLFPSELAHLSYRCNLNSIFGSKPALSYYGQTLFQAEEERNCELLEQDLITRLHQEPTNAIAWGALALLTSSETITFPDGSQISQQDCLLKAVELNPDEPSLWNDLCRFLGEDGSSVLINGFRTTEAHCAQRAVVLDSKNGTYWNNLGNALAQSGETVTILNATMSAQDCYLRACELAPESGTYWNNLGCALDQSGKSVTILNDTMSVQDCYRHACELDPNEGRYWYNLGYILNQSERIVTVQNETMSAQDCYLRACELDPHEGLYWSDLGHALNQSEKTVTFHNKTMSAQDCYLRACELDPKNSMCWERLGNLLARSQQVVTRHHQQITDQDCYIRALELNPKEARYWTLVQKSLLRHKNSLRFWATPSCQVNGKKVTPSLCQRQIQAFSKPGA